MELENNNHSVFSLNYHLVMVVKYRRYVRNSGGAPMEVIRKYIESQGER